MTGPTDPALRALASIATPRPWIREWESLRVHSAFGGDDVLLRQHNIDFAVAAVHYVDDALAAAEAAPLDVERLARAIDRAEDQAGKSDVPFVERIAREYAALRSPDTETAGEATEG